MFKKILQKNKRYAQILSLFIFVGFFSCLMHISPELFHHDNDNHSETAQVHMSCVDHESSTFSNSRDTHLDLLVAIIPGRFEIIIKSIEYINTDSEVIIQEVKPPDKIALYIKNNVFRL